MNKKNMFLYISLPRYMSLWFIKNNILYIISFYKYIFILINIIYIIYIK